MDKLTVFIAVTSVAVVLQTLILGFMFLAMRKSAANLDALSSEVRSKALPAIEQAQAVLAEIRPQMNSILDNVNHSTAMIRGHVTRLDATLNDALDRTRLQVIRADELLTRTLDKVEDTTEAVQNTVMAPVRQLSGIMHGISTGVSFLLGRQRNGRESVGVPQDEMFI
jgi:ABC-type transporter Mla subunit MlaD